MDEYKVISQKKIYKTKLFEVREEELLLPNGKTRRYNTVERRPTVVVFPIGYSYELYLIYEYRYLFNKRILEAVAGHIDEGEMPLAAAKRELKEETGLSASQWEEITKVETSVSVIRSLFYIFMARELQEGIATPSQGEEIELVKISLAEAVEKVMLGEINNAPTMIGILLLDKMRKEKVL